MTEEKKQIVIYVHSGLIEMGAKKWAKQAAFIFSRQRNNTVVGNWQEKETIFGCLINKEFKQSLDLSSILVKD